MQDFENALTAATAAGLLTNVVEISEGVWSADAPHGWAAVARDLAATLPGILTPNMATGGVGWKCGGGPLRAVIVPLASLSPIMRARDVFHSLVPPHERGAAVPWSMGGVARRLLVWTADKQPASARVETLIDADSQLSELMYHDCTPGVYPAAVMYDVAGYFYNLLRRLPSLRVTLAREPLGGSDRLLWQAFAPDERERWGDVLAAVESTKVLRNSLWGASLGSMARRPAYTSAAGKGRPPVEPVNGRRPVRMIEMTFGAGPFRPAAIVLARSAAEMCAIASEECGSVYSTVDSVTAVDGREPQIWERMGLPWGAKAEGPADIVGRGVWRVGPTVSLPYAPRVKLPKVAGEPPRWTSDVAAALEPGYTSKQPRTAVPRVAFSELVYRQWL